MQQEQTIPKIEKTVATDTHCADNNGKKGDGLLYSPKLSIKEAAKMIGIGETKMRQLIGDGDISVIMIHGKYLLLERDLEDYLKGHYGRVKEADAQASKRPALPKHVAESDLMKKN